MQRKTKKGKALLKPSGFDILTALLYSFYIAICIATLVLLSPTKVGENGAGCSFLRSEAVCLYCERAKKE